MKNTKNDILTAVIWMFASMGVALAVLNHMPTRSPDTWQNLIAIGIGIGLGAVITVQLMVLLMQSKTLSANMARAWVAVMSVAAFFSGLWVYSVGIVCFVLLNAYRQQRQQRQIA